MTILNLGEFEDAYYATCAKLKELLQGVDLLLANGFRSPGDTYVVYERRERLNGLDPISVGDFKACLNAYASILYSNEFSDLLNKGIMKKNMRNKYDIQKQVGYGYSTADDDLERKKTDQHENCKQAEQHIQRRHKIFQQNLGWLTGIGGLQDTSNMSCSMIYGSLAEKYRPMVADIESRGASIHREPTPDAPQVFQEISSARYVSPYNLNERAKKLNIPGGPEMPCLCDPECICAPVCASDPTQNCLCEENGLFTCVTQGMDIDDLDVPDLVRRRRHGSETSGSSVSSFITGTEVEPQTYLTYHGVTKNHLSNQYQAKDEVEQQKQEQEAIASNDEEIPYAFPMNVEIADVENGRFWQRQDLIPLRASSLSYREALRQPFSKECEFPPKRSSVAQRLFSSRKTGVTNKKVSTLKQTTKGYTASGATRKTLKQTNKLSLADMSLTGLRFALRRDSQMHD